MINDFKTLGITKKADTKEEIGSNLASAEQTLSNLTNTVLNPLLKFIKMATDYLNGFTFQTHVIEPFFKGLKIIFAILPLVGQFFRDDLEPTPSPPKSKPKRKKNEDNNNDYP